MMCTPGNYFYYPVPDLSIMTEHDTIGSFMLIYKVINNNGHKKYVELGGYF